jgi:hypothetical protein
MLVRRFLPQNSKKLFFIGLEETVTRIGENRTHWLAESTRTMWEDRCLGSTGKWKNALPHQTECIRHIFGIECLSEKQKH